MTGPAHFQFQGVAATVHDWSVGSVRRPWRTVKLDAGAFVLPIAVAEEIVRLRNELKQHQEKYEQDKRRQEDVLRRRDDWVTTLQKQCCTLKAECRLRDRGTTRAQKRGRPSSTGDAGRRVKAFADSWEALLELLPEGSERNSVDDAFWPRLLLSTHDDKFQQLLSEAGRGKLRDVFDAVQEERSERRYQSREVS